MTQLKEGYKLWHGFLNRLPRTTRYTLGTKIDNIFTDLIATALTAKFARQDEKIIRLKQISEGLDHLKYFLTILWEIKGIDSGKLSALGSRLAAVGKMVGGLLKSIS
ncbi:MAG: four helix bundle protein [Patescibacteria group bacterium]